MKAAVVQSFDRLPALVEFPMPEAAPHEVLVRVEAAALSQLARGQAAGRHYSAPSLPFVPGADGVGRLAGGERAYFAFPRRPWGAMGEWTTVDRRNVIPIPESLDPVTTAAIANPAMASWAALNERAMFAAGESVLINGANGVAGRLAIRNAKLLGAGRIVVTAREESAREELARLGADAFISLSAAPDGVVDEVEREVARGIDVVLDYLWGRPAECVVQAVMNGAKRSAPRRVRFVNIGSLAGMDMSLAAAALRSSRIELMGSGLGSVTEERLASSAAAAVMALGAHLDGIPIRGVAIESLPAHWHAETTARLVFTF